MIYRAKKALDIIDPSFTFPAYFTMRTTLTALALALVTGCTPEAADAPSPARPAVLASSMPDPFGDYWYQGEAELTSYTLEQARYGEVHQGEAVLIFVTEDLSRRKQVKLDDPAAAGDDAVKVMKLNLTKKFDTGIYPYSMMTSVFTPVYRAEDGPTLKVTTTSQEWCGHTFTQVNRRGEGYEVHLYSYFESEGDQRLTLEGAVPEDELWNLIRLAPDALPTGAVRLIPGTLFQRLRHSALTVQEAHAELRPAEGEAGLRAYTLTYPALDRTLTIRFNAAFPHEIESWEETYRSGFGPDAKPLTTRARRNKRIMLDYWNHNHLADAALRAELGLE